MKELFSKFFKDKDENESKPQESEKTETAAEESQPEPKKPKPAPRRVINAPVIQDEDEPTGQSDEIKIKAIVDELDFAQCKFVADRPLLKDYSAWFPSAGSARRNLNLRKNCSTLKACCRS